MNAALISNLNSTLLAEITSLGRAGQSLRAIERATGIRRERVSAILKKSGIPVRAERTRAAPAVASGATATTSIQDDSALAGGEAPAATVVRVSAVSATEPMASAEPAVDLATVTATGQEQARGDPSPASPRGKNEELFSWHWPELDGELGVAYRLAPSTDITPVLERLRLPATLSRPDVRVLRSLAGAATRNKDAAWRCGIDPWVGRQITSPDDLRAVAAEIERALEAITTRYRLGGR